MQPEQQQRTATRKEKCKRGTETENTSSKKEQQTKLASEDFSIDNSVQIKLLPPVTTFELYTSKAYTWR